MTPELPRHVLKWPDAGVEMAFRLIPAGEFLMGSRGHAAHEEPVHWVRIPEPFWMAETPVTQRQFALWTRADGIEHRHEFPGRLDHPAQSMDWRHAVRYCTWLGRVKAAEMPEGYALACLPTEAEWEYACRAGTGTEYCTGDGEAALTTAGWFGGAWNFGCTSLAGQKGPNAFGVYDMHGNVWEWCHDAWDEAVYRGHVDGDQDPGWPKRLCEMQEGHAQMLVSDETRLLRGGSWISFAADCRSGSRDHFVPDGRNWSIGLRVCLTRGVTHRRNERPHDT